MSLPSTLTPVAGGYELCLYKDRLSLLSVLTVGCTFADEDAENSPMVVFRDRENILGQSPACLFLDGVTDTWSDLCVPDMYQ